MRALIVAYYFPPKGGAGTQRFAKFCKFLPEFGIEPIVLTVAVATKTAHAPTDDASLAIGERTEVVRVAVPSSVSIGQRVRRALRLHLDEDEWARAAAQRALEVAKERRVDVVVTTLSPYACYRIGERVQRELGVPWVVDLRDPWALDGWRVYPTAMHAAADLGHMRRALTRADFVVANVPECKREFVALGADPARTVVIPNGFDEDDFAQPAPRPARDGRFHVVHVGTLHGVDVAPGFTANRFRRVRHRQIAPLGRTGHYLLHALALWAAKAGPRARELVVDLYGHVDQSHQQLVAQLGIGDSVVLHGYVPHRQSIAALCAADAVFVPLHDVPPGERALVVPGKMYEALASERPVLAALPPGDGADLVRALGAGICVPPADAAALAQALETCFRDRPDGVSRARLSSFARANLTADLARVLTAAAARKREIAVVDPWARLRGAPG